ncbi:hypothetical protein M0765_026320 [Variovorax sp. S2]|uniref:hypothetical protein n=1 Tax=Variovorax sp. S12S4 TaxID=3029170 RepID=UPI00215CD54F|nr:hypothetical protein [Variovorax sp. S12S4]MCR8961114.1 hypothetical protein [Variovorax sp. S12S4]
MHLWLHGHMACAGFAAAKRVQKEEGTIFVVHCLHAFNDSLCRMAREHFEREKFRTSLTLLHSIS